MIPCLALLVELFCYDAVEILAELAYIVTVKLIYFELPPLALKH